MWGSVHLFELSQRQISSEKSPKAAVMVDMKGTLPVTIMATPVEEVEVEIPEEAEMLEEVTGTVVMAQTTWTLSPKTWKRTTKRTS